MSGHRLAIRILRYGAFFCELFGLLCTVIFGLLIFFESGWTARIIFIIITFSGIAAMIIGYIIRRRWLGIEEWGGRYGTGGAYIPSSPNSERFGSQRKLKETANNLILFGIITIPGTFGIGGLLLLIAGILLRLRIRM